MKITRYYTVGGVAAMRNTRPAAAFFSVLLLLAVTATQLVGFAEANPISGPPDAFTNPPTVTILSTLVNGNNVSINFKANVGESTTAEHMQINRVYYTSDWNQNVTYVYECLWLFDSQEGAEFSYKLNVTDMPEGNRTVTVYAEEFGYYKSLIGFYTTGFSSVNFTVDTTSPDVSVLSLDGITYESSDVPLNFSVSEPVSKIAYVLDGQDNVTVNGNTTLTGLSAGMHNVTVYVWDAAGNVGVSETVTFTVEPFPAVPVAAASVAVVASVSAGILVYFKKRRH